MKICVITPEGEKIVEDGVDAVVVSTILGEITVLPSHTPLLAGLSTGRMILTKKQEQRFFAVSGGYIEVAEDNVIILTQSCESADEIDAERAERAKERALESLKNLSPADGEAYKIKLNALKRAETRLKIAHKKFGDKK